MSIAAAGLTARGLYYSRRHRPFPGGRDVRLPPERFDYSAIVDRRPWKLPRGARIAVWTIVNVEEWDIEKAMARQYLTSPQGVATIPDVPNWAWHDYGMRVGFWRLYEALAKRRLRATTAINANVCHSYPRVAQAMLDAGWEFMGHGVQAGRHAPAARPARGRPRHGGHHRRSSPARSPRAGWGPASPRRGRRSTCWPRRASSTSRTGSTTTSPTRSAPRHGPLVSVPYTLELNDIPMMVIQHHESSAWVQRCRDQFDRLLRRGGQGRRA